MIARGPAKARAFFDSWRNYHFPTLYGDEVIYYEKMGTPDQVMNIVAKSNKHGEGMYSKAYHNQMHKAFPPKKIDEKRPPLPIPASKARPKPKEEVKV